MNPSEIESDFQNINMEVIIDDNNNSNITEITEITEEEMKIVIFH